jgi:hypothetical protein
MTYKELEQKAEEVISLVRESGFSESTLVDAITFHFMNVASAVEDDVLERFKAVFVNGNKKRYYP